MLTFNKHVLLLIFFLSLVFSGCDSTDSPETDNAESPSITRSVDATVLNSNDACLDPNLAPNAAIYVIEGQLNDIRDITAQDITPIMVADVVKTQNGTYEYNVVFVSVGDYMTLLTCNPKAEPSQITFIQGAAEHFIVDIDKSSNLDTSKKNDMHLNSTEECSGCHSFGQTYIVSTVDHDYVRGVCVDCHLPADQAAISVNVDVNRAPISNTCNSAENLNAAKIYVVEGSVDRIDTITAADITPILMTPLIDDQDGIYRFVLTFASNGDYTALLSCSLATEPSAITFVTGYHFFVTFQDMSGVDISQLPEMHLNTTNACFSCHAFGNNYIVSSVNHDAIEAVCSECHTNSTPTGQASAVITLQLSEPIPL